MISACTSCTFYKRMLFFFLLIRKKKKKIEVGPSPWYQDCQANRFSNSKEPPSILNVSTQWEIPTTKQIRSTRSHKTIPFRNPDSHVLKYGCGEDGVEGVQVDPIWRAVFGYHWIWRLVLCHSFLGVLQCCLGHETTKQAQGVAETGVTNLVKKGYLLSEPVR